MLSPLRMAFLWMSLLLMVGLKRYDFSFLKHHMLPTCNFYLLSPLSSLINFSIFGFAGNRWFKRCIKQGDTEA